MTVTESGKARNPTSTISESQASSYIELSGKPLKVWQKKGNTMTPSDISDGWKNAQNLHFQQLIMQDILAEQQVPGMYLLINAVLVCCVFMEIKNTLFEQSIVLRDR